MVNISQPPITLVPLGEDLCKATLVAAAVAVATTAVAPLLAPVEELVEEAIAEAEATRTAMSVTTNVVATTPATGSRRYVVPIRLPTLVTATASPPNLHDFALCFFPRSSSLLGSPSMMQIKIQFSGSSVMP
jgi:hypothetical protein